MRCRGGRLLRLLFAWEAAARLVAAQAEDGAPSPLLALLRGRGDSDASLTCEDDAVWAEVKRALYHQLRQTLATGRLDWARCVHSLTDGVSAEDLRRCPVGAARLSLLFVLYVS